MPLKNKNKQLNINEVKLIIPNIFYNKAYLYKNDIYLSITKEQLKDLKKYIDFVIKLNNEFEF